MPNPKFSIVVPLYKSQEHLSKLVSFVSESFKGNPDSVELILVIDGKEENVMDETFKQRLNSYQSVKVINLKKNYGQHIATACGMSKSSGQYIITMDADMYVISGLFDKTLNFIDEEFDLIYADINFKGKDWLRKTGSCLHGWIIRTFIKKAIPVAHDGSSFRIIKKELKSELLKNMKHTSGIDIELINRAKRIHFIPMDVTQSNGSSYSIFKLIFLLINTLTGPILSRINPKHFNPESYIHHEQNYVEAG